MSPQSAIVTLARGRRRHLERQVEAVARMDPAPDGYVVVSMDEHPPDLAGAVDLTGAIGGKGRPLPAPSAVPMTAVDLSRAIGGKGRPLRAPSAVPTTAVDLSRAMGGKGRPRIPSSTDPAAAVDLRGGIGAKGRPRVVHMPVGDGDPLPLAAARNAGIAAAAYLGAELVVCLDADCLPEREMLGALLAARRLLGDGCLLAGPVGRLGPRDPAAALPGDDELIASRRAAEQGPRPVPSPGAVLREPRAELFWSLSFAVTVADHERVGGFDEGYVGYGAEDTDYAFRARAAGVDLAWVGGAWAHHQHHPVSSPPVEHLAEIVINARRFRSLWGSWPMEGWLGDFALAGLVDWDPKGTRLELLGDRVGELGG